MKIFPAIDLRDGKAVRLYQGDYDQMTVYSEDPVDVARSFKEKGASYLHLVDLDGAKDGQLVNFETIRRIVEEVDLFVEVGGGIRDEKRICQYLDLGVGLSLIHIYPQCRTMAVCHDLQIVDDLPAEEHDIRPDAIVSEEQILL